MQRRLACRDDRPAARVRRCRGARRRAAVHDRRPSTTTGTDRRAVRERRHGCSRRNHRPPVLSRRRNKGLTTGGKGAGMPTSFFNLYAPPLTAGDEKPLLHAHLQLHRDALLWKLEGLGETDLRRPMTGTGTNLLGLVKHLTGVEGAYFCDAFGRERPRLAWEADEDATLGEFSDMYAKPDETAEEIVANYRAATAAADQSISDLELDATGRHHIGI